MGHNAMYQATYWLLAWHILRPSKMVATFSSETSVDFKRAIRRYILVEILQRIRILFYCIFTILDSRLFFLDMFRDSYYRGFSARKE
jgi:hypothetical protein